MEVITFLQILTSYTHEEDTAPNRWNFKKADWLSFRTSCQARLMQKATMSAEDPASKVTALLTETAEETIPRIRISSERLSKISWFNQCH